MKKNIIASTACAVALAAALGGAAAIAIPTTALANDGTVASDTRAAHYEGETVTIGEDWGQPVYAEWHRGASGRWWATFWTYNGHKIWAEPAIAGCGWAFHVYDANGDFVNVYRCEESTQHGVVGREGVSSHWQDDSGNWY